MMHEPQGIAADHQPLRLASTDVARAQLPQLLHWRLVSNN